MESSPKTSGPSQPPQPPQPNAAGSGRLLVDALAERLQRDLGEPVERMETHISWILLCGERAYKLKKPVRFSFVDFSTPAARKHFCEEEVRLNQRLAAPLYLGVVPVRGSVDDPWIDDGDARGPGSNKRDGDSEGNREGEAIDHVVRMQRFPQSDLLSERVSSGRIQPAQLDALAQRLARFHGQACVAPPLSAWGAPEQVNGAVLAVLDALRSARPGGLPESVEAWVDDKARALGTAWLLRQRTGAIREGHGDLHLANVVLWQGEPMAFDCVEFEEALRWIDVMSDLAFLTMDLRARGRSDLAHRVLDGYLQASGDYEGLTVLRFYEVYRALVRALVAGLRKSDATADGAPQVDYLGCAEALCRAESAGLMITHGLSGSGKSSVAAELVARTGAIRIRSDVERKRLFGLQALQRGSADSAVEAEAGLYGAEATARTYSRLAHGVRIAVNAGYRVIVDAAFLRHDERQSFHRLATELGVPFTILDCSASVAELRRRVQARHAAADDASDADVAVLERQLGFHQPLYADEQSVALQVVTDQPFDPASVADRWLSMIRDGSA